MKIYDHNSYEIYTYVIQRTTRGIGVSTYAGCFACSFSTIGVFLPVDSQRTQYVCRFLVLNIHVRTALVVVCKLCDHQTNTSTKL